MTGLKGDLEAFVWTEGCQRSKPEQAFRVLQFRLSWLQLRADVIYGGIQALGRLQLTWPLNSRSLDILL